MTLSSLDNFEVRVRGLSDAMMEKLCNLPQIGGLWIDEETIHPGVNEDEGEVDCVFATVLPDKVARFSAGVNEEDEEGVDTSYSVQATRMLEAALAAVGTTMEVTPLEIKQPDGSKACWLKLTHRG